MLSDLLSISPSRFQDDDQGETHRVLVQCGANFEPLVTATPFPIKPPSWGGL